MASKGFLPVDQYMRIKGIPIKGNKLTMESDTDDKVMALDHDACANSNVNNTPEEESEESLPSTLHNFQHCLIHYTCIESEESSGDSNSDGSSDHNGGSDYNGNSNGKSDCNNNHDEVKDHERQYISKSRTLKTEISDVNGTHTTSHYPDDL